MWVVNDKVVEFNAIINPAIGCYDWQQQHYHQTVHPPHLPHTIENPHPHDLNPFHNHLPNPIPHLRQQTHPIGNEQLIHSLIEPDIKTEWLAETIADIKVGVGEITWHPNETTIRCNEKITLYHNNQPIIIDPLTPSAQHVTSNQTLQAIKLPHTGIKIGRLIIITKPPTTPIDKVAAIGE